jgi:hypothetical protein
MYNYFVASRYENGNVHQSAYVFAKSPKEALGLFIKKKELPDTSGFGYKSNNRTTTFRDPYSWYTVTNASPSRKELADTLYQLTKTYLDGTCYESSNPYSKPHVKEALEILKQYSGATNYLDATEKMEAIGHVYKYKQP